MDADRTSDDGDDTHSRAPRDDAHSRAQDGATHSGTAGDEMSSRAPTDPTRSRAFDDETRLRASGAARSFARAREFVSHSPEATERLGEDLGARLGAGVVVALHGELGSGKTCFVRGLARGLGVRDPVTSPTYALLQTYSGRRDLHHFDAWMEGRERALLADGGAEWLFGDGVSAIEWASRVREYLPKTRVELAFEHAGPSSRRIRVAAVGEGPGLEVLARAIDELWTAPDLDERDS